MRKEVKNILICSLVLNIILATSKLVVGLIGNSFSLFSDGINSVLDVLISIMLIVTLNISNKKPDKDHPYGHEKYEVIVSLVLGMFLIVTSGILIFTSIVNFNKANSPDLITIIVALISIVIKFLIYLLVLRGYKKYDQISLKAESINHLGDILATSISLIGIVIARLGFHYFDYIASIIIGLLIFYNGFKVIKDSVKYIVDESPSKDFNDEVKAFIKNLPGVLSIDDYKSRIHVNKIYIDIEISVDRNLSLIKAHQIAEEVHISVEDNFQTVTHCMVHVNPSKM